MRLFKTTFIPLLLISVYGRAQTNVPMTYSPDGTVNSIIAKGDTLIVGGNFNHVGKYTGGGALIDAQTGLPDLNFPKINGQIFNSTSDGRGGFYVYGNYYRESEISTQKHYRLEHILADNTFEPDFSFVVSSLFYTRFILFHNNIIYVCGKDEQTINGIVVGSLAGISVVNKSLVNGLPPISRANPAHIAEITRIIANDNSLYFIGTFDLVGGLPRSNAASVQLGTGTVKSWNPSINWANYYYYADLLFYRDQIIIGGSFNEGLFPSTEGHSCAKVDTTSGNSFAYIFQSGLPTPTHSYLHFQADVTAISVRNDTLYTYSVKSSTGDTRVTALNLAASNTTLWTRHFNYYAQCRYAKMQIIGNAIFVLGHEFKYIYDQTFINQSNTIERYLNGAGVKLNLQTGALEDWYPEPTGSNPSFLVRSSDSYADKLLIGGDFSHVNSVKRNGVYLYNTSTETVMPFNPDFMDFTSVSAMKLDKENLYLGGTLNRLAYNDHSLLAFNVNTGNILNWYPPKIGNQVYYIESNDQFVFVGGSLNEPSGGLDRKNLFAIDKSSGQLTNWAPNPNFPVRVLNISHNQLFVGGDFRNISGEERNYAASFNLSKLSITGWNPNFNGTVYTYLPKGGGIWAGGNFSRIGGNNSYRISSIDAISATNNINSNTIISGTPVRTLAAKGCKLLVAGDISLSNNSPCFNLIVYDLEANSFSPDSLFCTSIGTKFSNSVKALTFIGNELYFVGTFTKVNNHTKNTNIGRISFPSNYFTECNIGNCGQAVSLTSAADDYTTGSYLQKTNQPISATNKVTGNSQYSLQSNSNILLLPNTPESSGFLAKPDSGGSFKAEIVPCN